MSDVVAAVVFVLAGLWSVLAIVSGAMLFLTSFRRPSKKEVEEELRKLRKESPR